MPTQKASAIVERRVTAWHESGHVIATLAAKHFDLSDPAIDLRPGPKGTAFVGAKRLDTSYGPTEAEAREIVKIACSGLIAQDWLERISHDEGRTIYPDEAFAKGDFLTVDSELAKHGLDAERDALWEAAQETIGTHALALIKLGDLVWRSNLQVWTRADLLAIPELAAIARGAGKGPPPRQVSSPTSAATPGGAAGAAGAPGGIPSDPARPDGPEQQTGLWSRIARWLGLD